LLFYRKSPALAFKGLPSFLVLKTKALLLLVHVVLPDNKRIVVLTVIFHTIIGIVPVDALLF
jgi:hypothetical protein